MAYGKIKADAIVYDNSGSDVEVSTADITSKAGLASPTFTGTPAAPTASQGTNTTQLATTAFVNAEIAADTASKAPLASPTFTGTVTIPSGASIADIGTTIQAFDADTAKRDTTNTYTALQTMNAGIAVDGPYKQTAETVSALDIDLSTGNYFKKSISTSSTVTFSNPPASGTVGSFTLELVLTGSSTAITWPAGTGGQGTVYWNGDAGTTAPTLVDARTHLFMFVTTDGGTKYRGAVLSDYTG